jgi:hypothetical protein
MTENSELIARFYDNDQYNIQQFKERLPIIKCILVDDSIPNDILKNISNKFYYNFIKNSQQLYPNSFSKNNKYAVYTLKEGGEIVMPSRGLTKDMINDIILTYQKPALNKYLFLDWDRTISVIEGFICPYYPDLFINHNIDNYNDILAYIVGGEERINLFKLMYKTLINNNTKIFILTNNPTASKYDKGNRPEFLQIIRIMFPEFLQEHLICSYDFGSDKITALRGTILEDGTRLNDICNELFQKNDK